MDVLNILTVDVEDYFHVSAFSTRIRPAQWESMESRVCDNTDRLLDIFAAARVRATFFVLGWVAERYPALVRRIRAGGHELASHSYSHRLVYEMTPAEFRHDLNRARQAIEDAAGVAVRGYRAPSYSITNRSLWALDVLIDEGYHYDSSIYPIRHDRYGIPAWSREIDLVRREGGCIWELPGATVRRAGVNLPIGGGGYFRLLPYAWTRFGIRHVNTVEGRPAVFYLHPWEVDPAQPRLDCPALSRWRHYGNLGKTEDRLRRLLADFQFAAISDVLDTTVQAASPAGELRADLVSG